MVKEDVCNSRVSTVALTLEANKKGGGELTNKNDFATLSMPNHLLSLCLHVAGEYIYKYM